MASFDLQPSFFDLPDRYGASIRCRRGPRAQVAGPGHLFFAPPERSVRLQSLEYVAAAPVRRNCANTRDRSLDRAAPSLSGPIRRCVEAHAPGDHPMRRADQLGARRRSINGWVLKDAVALKEPIPCKGELGLWNSEAAPSP